MQTILKENLPLIFSLFKENKVVKAYAFGSAVSNNFNSESDFDFLISFDESLSPIQKGENWFSIYYSLKKLLRRDVDLLREEDIKNPYLLKSINNNKELIYGE